MCVCLREHHIEASRYWTGLGDGGRGRGTASGKDGGADHDLDRVEERLKLNGWLMKASE